jgi:hypothetical protein
MKGKHAVLAFGFLGGLSLAGIVGGILLVPYLEPRLPTADPAGIVWTSYADESLGFAFDVPEEYEVEPDERGAVLRLGGSAIVHVAWVDDEEGRRRGLWSSHDPAGPIELGGRTGNKYEYNNYDALSGVRSHAWVVPHRGKSLGIELRTRRVSLLESLGVDAREEIAPDATGMRIVESFRFLPES